VQNKDQKRGFSLQKSIFSAPLDSSSKTASTVAVIGDVPAFWKGPIVAIM
jgi:hypothetical protein